MTPRSDSVGRRAGPGVGALGRGFPEQKGAGDGTLDTVSVVPGMAGCYTSGAPRQPGVVIAPL